MKAHLFSALLLTVSVAAVSAAEVSGKVTLKGTPPPERDITDLKNDATCGKLHATMPTTRHYVVGKDGGLGNVFVYVKTGAPKDAKPAVAEPVMDQKDCIYEPYVMGAMTNQKVKFRNSDPVLHNVHATPAPDKGNKEFNIGQPQGAPDIEKSFASPEVLVRLKCDVHPWMFGYIGVLDHPYFAVTDKDGNFTIKGLPNGKYTVVAYHLKTHGKTSEGVVQEWEVTGDKKTDFTVELPAK